MHTVNNNDAGPQGEERYGLLLKLAKIAEVKRKAFSSEKMPKPAEWILQAVM